MNTQPTGDRARHASPGPSPAPAPGPSRSLARELGLSRREARAAFGAVRAIVLADGPPGEHPLRLLAVAASTLEVDASAPVASPAEVADAFASPAARRALVDALVIPACVGGEVTSAGEALVLRYARALGVRSHWADLLGAMRRRSVLAVKGALVRRSPDARRLFARTWAEEGTLAEARSQMGLGDTE